MSNDENRPSTGQQLQGIIAVTLSCFYLFYIWLVAMSFNESPPVAALICTLLLGLVIGLNGVLLFGVGRSPKDWVRLLSLFGIALLLLPIVIGLATVPLLS